MMSTKKYKVVFLSNFLNHHQLPFCQELCKLTDNSFLFIATTPVPEGRKQLGYHDMNSSYDFVFKAYESQDGIEKAKEYVLKADVVIYGNMGFHFIKKRLEKKLLTFRMSERSLKIQPKWYKMPYLRLRNFFANTIHKNFYVLCAGAYVASDYRRLGSFKNKAYKWGYFPEVKEYENIDGLIADKKRNSILWAGRMIDWKHPEYPVEIAKRLRDDGYDFEMNIIGTGPMETNCSYEIAKLDLQDKVHMLGSMSPEKVREYMESSQIFLFTSDRQEGWGAVLNESMNSGCAVIANENIGAVPYLINDGENGLIYHNDSIDELYQKTKEILDDEGQSSKLGKNAYNTMINMWNAKNAAERFLNLAEELKNNKKCTLYENGPCSVAEVHKRKK